MTPRNPFTRVEDIKFVKYLAKYSAGTKGRSGNALYKRLVENAGGRWSWAASHSWQSWREHYVRQKNSFDHKIALLQKYEACQGARSDSVLGASSPEKTNQTRQRNVNRQGSFDFPPIRTIEDQVQQSEEQRKAGEDAGRVTGAEGDAATTSVQPQQPQEPSAHQEASSHSADQADQVVEPVEVRQTVSRMTIVQKPTLNDVSCLPMEERETRPRQPVSVEKRKTNTMEELQDVVAEAVTSKSKGKRRIPDVSFTELDVGEAGLEASEEDRKYASRHGDRQASDTNAARRKAERKRKASYSAISIPEPKRQRTVLQSSPGSGRPSPSAHAEADNISHIVSEALNMPAPEISPQDLQMTAQIGLHMFFKAMSKNHGFTEDFVRRVYERRRGLRATDLALARARIKAERAALLESSDSDSDSDSDSESGADLAPNQNLSNRRLSYPIQSHPRESVKGAMMFDLADLRELDLSRLREQGSSVSNSRNRLLYTPGDRDLSLAREDGPYIPPSSSRAAKYLQAQKRKSLTASSLRKPVTAGSAEEPVAGPSMRHADQKSSTSSDSVQEEREVLRSVIRQKALKSKSAESHSGSNSARQQETCVVNEIVDKAQPHEVTSSPANGKQGRQEELTWTKEEDAILLQGEDNEQRKEILANRGLFAARSRLIELIFS